MTVGNNIKTIRKRKHLTQEELAKKAKMSRSYLADVERDRYNASISTLKSIAAALNVSPRDLIDDVEFTESELEGGTNNYLRKIMRQINSVIDYSKYENGEIMDDKDRQLIHTAFENAFKLAEQIAKRKSTHK